MIIEIPNENSIVKWKNDDKDEWKVAEISDLIKAYERPKGDLISREALKKALSDKDLITWTHEYGDAIPLDWLMSAIDNAPTVETDILYLCDHKKCGENFNCYECNHTSDIRHAINFDLMEFPRSVFVERIRPQGEWLEDKVAFHFVCNRCGCALRQLKSEVFEGNFDYNYCPNCGAEMQKTKNDSL